MNNSSLIAQQVSATKKFLEGKNFETKHPSMDVALSMESASNVDAEFLGKIVSDLSVGSYIQNVKEAESGALAMLSF